MTGKDKAVLAERLKKLSADISDLAALFEADGTSAEKEAVVPAAPPQAPPRTCTYEEVRAVLAEKARMGYRVEVRTLITKHGAEQLSDIKDPAVYGEILTEAEELGNG
ncbi:MAG: DNA ligase [Oscillospiraceae bacterium]|nr:DNA ligase [Oscillospiraceae bacterium]